MICCLKKNCIALVEFNINVLLFSMCSGGSRGGAQVPLLILGKKEEMTEGKKASRLTKSRPPLPPTTFSSRCGSATDVH